MKIYLDDVRDLPDGYQDWVVIRTAEEALATITRTGLENIESISFDHDLGEDCMSGYDLAAVIEEMVYEGVSKVPEFHIHSANPVGRKNLESCFRSIARRITENPFTP